MIPQIDTFKEKSFGRPSDFIDPNDKRNFPDYSLQYCKFLYSQYLIGNTGIKFTDYDRFLRNRLYALGSQDPDIYRKAFTDEGNEVSQTVGIDEDEDKFTHQMKREAWVNMNFDDIFSPLPKYIMNIMGIFESQEHEIIVEAEDEKSYMEKEINKYTLLAESENRDLINAVDSTFGIPQMPRKVPIPDNQEEIYLYEGLGVFELNCEIAYKRLLNHTDYLSKQNEIKREIIRDLVTTGVTGTITKVDVSTGKVVNEHIDVADVIIEESKKNDYSDSTYWATIEYYTIADIRKITGWSEEVLEEIAKKFTGKYNNPMRIERIGENDETYSYENFKIPILSAYWLTVDSEYRTKRINQYNEEIEVYEPYRKRKGKVLPPKVYNTENRKTTKTDLSTLYQAKWVLDTEYVFDYGRFRNIPYDYSTKEVESPIRIYRLPTKPLIESMIPIADQIMFTFLRLQNAIVKSPPPGLKIEFGSIENLSYDGSSTLSPKDVIKIYSQTGNIIYRLQPTVPGINNPAWTNPIEELRGGVGTAIEDAIKALELFYRQLDIISGIDPVTSVSKFPEERQGKAVTEIAVSATSNTLRPIYSAYLNIKQAQSKCVSFMINSLFIAYEDDKENNPYKGLLGDEYLESIYEAAEYPPIRFGFKMIPKANDQQKQEVILAAREALSGRNEVPLITYSEYLFLIEQLDTDDGLKFVRLFLGYREGIKKKENALLAQQAQAAQGEQNRMLEQTRLQGEMARIQAEEAKEINIINAQLKADMTLEEFKFNLTNSALQGQTSLKTENTT